VEIDLSPTAVDRFLAATLERPGFPGEPNVVADTAFEARLAVNMLRSLKPSTDIRILEVGAGSGTVTAFLAHQGANIVGIEPYRQSYEGFEPIRTALEAGGSDPELLTVRAEELSLTVHGGFDLIFSVNVIEHFQPLETSLDGLERVLLPGGRMVHTCPNYRIPYEPHLRAPLVPRYPALTARLRPGLRQDPVWATLNWVTVSDIRRFAKRHGLVLRFRPGQLAETLERLSYDPAFARRQQTIARLAALPAVAKAAGLLPTTWSTPMTFEVVKPLNHKQRSLHDHVGSSIQTRPHLEP
jgi:SAM-dependent methyltransferase